MKPITQLLFVSLVAASLAPAVACGPSAEEKAVREAFQKFLDGLDRADAAQLWALADDPTHAFFDDLARETREALAEVDAGWPAASRASARRAIAGDFVGDSSTGLTLFGHFLDPRRLQAPRDPSARGIDRVELSGTTAKVILKSGESLDFASDAAGAWRTAIFLAPAKELPGVTTLRENLATVRANALILKGADTDSTRTGVPR